MSAHNGPGEKKEVEENNREELLLENLPDPPLPDVINFSQDITSDKQSLEQETESE